MKSVSIPIKEGENFSDALKNKGYLNIPSNVLINKTLTGIGGTHMEIYAKRPSIIIEPNVPVIKGKANENPDIFPIYKGVKIKSIVNRLNQRSVMWKKFMTTPESFFKIREAAKEAKINIYKEYFCLFDECEKITEDVEFRKRISQPIYDFMQFDGKALISATPLEISHKGIREHFTKLIIEPEFDYKKELTLIATNDFAATLQDELLKFSKKVCIFFNSTDGIKRVTRILPSGAKYQIFCSEEYQRKLTGEGFENVHSDFKLPLLDFNFFTARFFSAFDIKTTVNPDILILTDLNQALHTMIDPFTEAIQIQGRFRNGYNSLTHILNCSESLDVLTNDEISKMIEIDRNVFEGMKQKIHEFESPAAKRVYSKKIAGIPYSYLLDESGKLNEFAIDNLYNDARMNRYYTCADLILKAYNETGHFLVSYQNETNRTSFSLLPLQKSKTIKEEIISIIDCIRGIENPFKLLTCFTPKYVDGQFIIDAYIKLGEEVFEKSQYRVDRIKKRVDKFNMKEQINSLEFHKIIWDSFPIGVKIDRDEIKIGLTKIFLENGVSLKVTHDTICNYFDVSKYGSENPKKIKLNSQVLISKSS